MSRTLSYGGRRMGSLSLPLSEMVVEYFDQYSPFDYLDIDFATKLSREGSVDPCTLLVAMVYMDRVRLTDRSLFETSDPADVYLSSLVVASKFLHDNGLEDYVHNDEWAASSNVPISYLNRLELQLLISLDWNLLVTSEEFDTFLKRTEISVALELLRRTGISTYNELNVLSDRGIFCQGILPFISMVGLCSIIYSAVAIVLCMSPAILTSFAVLHHRSRMMNEMHRSLSVAEIYELNDTIPTYSQSSSRNSPIEVTINDRDLPLFSERFSLLFPNRTLLQCS